MMSPDLRDAMICTDKCWKKIIQLIGKIHQLSSIIKLKKSFNNKIKESALISKMPNFNLSSGFYSLPDNIAQDIISDLRI